MNKPTITPELARLILADMDAQERAKAAHKSVYLAMFRTATGTDNPRRDLSGDDPRWADLGDLGLAVMEARQDRTALEHIAGGCDD